MKCCPKCGYRPRQIQTMTKAQHRVFRFVDRFIHKKGYAPSLAEIGKGAGLSSLATVHKHLSNLEKKGFIRRRYNCSRALEVA